LVRKVLHKVMNAVTRAVHLYRVPTRMALAACVMAAAIPALVAFSREADASATVESELAVATPAVMSPPGWTSDAAHSASMLIVGTLLIGVGSAIRRAA
jgi:negative regulator of sigma E activity